MSKVEYQPFDAARWRITDAGEAEYIGPTELEIIFTPPLVLGTKADAPDALASIKLSEPTAGQLSVFMSAQRTKDEAAASIDYIAANAGVAPTYIRKMRSRDFARAMDFLGGFTPPEKKLQGTSPGA